MKTDNCFHNLMHKYTMVYLPIQRRSSDKTVKTKQLFHSTESIF